MKQRMAESLGFHFILHHFKNNETQDNIIYWIEHSNKDEKIHGILVQLPLPVHLDQFRIINAISPTKDVDGITAYNMGCLALRVPNIHPCTPKGIITLINHYDIDMKGKNTVVIGSSNIVGRPIALELLLQGATVTVCHRFTKEENLKRYIQQAEILVVAVGKIGVVKSEWIKEGSVIIDVGINRNEHGKLVGDVDFNTASIKTEYITPVPGGVGPMTVISLMENTIECYNKLKNIL